MAKIFKVIYEVAYRNPTNVSGPTHKYRKGPQAGLVVSATDTDGIAAVLAADLSIGAGETIEVLSSMQVGGSLPVYN